MKETWRFFAERVAAGSTATDAYIQAGFKPANRKIAQRAASRLLRRPAVAEYLAGLRAEAAERGAEEAILTLEQKLAFLARTVKSSPAQVREGDDICQSYRTNRDGSVSVRLPCKLRAIKMHTDLMYGPAGQRLPREAPDVSAASLMNDIRESWTRALARRLALLHGEAALPTPPGTPE